MEDNSSNNIDPLFWLPSDFLTDDDIFIGQDNLNLTSNTKLPTDFPFDFTELTRHFASENKWALSGSPQSILSPVLSNGSPSGPSSPTAPFGKKDDQSSWNLICAAAGEVNMWKMQNQTANKNRALPTPPNIFNPLPFSNKYMNNHVKQNNGSVWGQSFGVPAEYGFGGNGRCGRAQRQFQCGWPALQVQKQHFNVNGCVSRPSLVLSGGLRNFAGSGVGLKKKCAGTGVFLPRTCPDPATSPVKPGCPASFIPSRPAPTLNVKFNYDVMSKGQAQPTVGDVNPDYDAMLMRRKAALAQWHNGMNMMGNRAMNCKMLLPEEWSY